MTHQVDSKLREFFDQMQGYWGCKDENSSYIYANEAHAKLVGFKNPLDMIGCSNFDIPCDARECAPLFHAQDQEVIASSKPLTILDIHPYAGGEWRAFVFTKAAFTKAPLSDAGKNIIGTIFQGLEVTSACSLELGSLLGDMQVSVKTSELFGQGSYLINQDRGPIQLTCRESEVLFFLLRGKAIKAISSVLALSDRTVEKYIRHLRVKFSAANRSELLDRAIELGYLSYIPQSLFSPQLSVMLRDA